MSTALTTASKELLRTKTYLGLCDRLISDIYIILIFISFSFLDCAKPKKTETKIIPSSKFKPMIQIFFNACYFKRFCNFKLCRIYQLFLVLKSCVSKLLSLIK